MKDSDREILLCERVILTSSTRSFILKTVPSTKGNNVLDGKFVSNWKKSFCALPIKVTDPKKITRRRRNIVEELAIILIIKSTNDLQHRREENMSQVLSPANLKP